MIGIPIPAAPRPPARQEPDRTVPDGVDPRRTAADTVMATTRLSGEPESVPLLVTSVYGPILFTSQVAKTIDAEASLVEKYEFSW